LNIQLADGGDQYLPIYCAVCDDVNEDFILTAQVVDQLQDIYNRKLVSTECNDNVNVNFHIDVNDASVTCNSISQTVNSDEIESVKSDERDDNEYLDVENISNIKSVTGEATADVLKQEQLADVTLVAPWHMTNQGKGIITS
jgi:hypothetical protein